VALVSRGYDPKPDLKRADELLDAGKPADALIAYGRVLVRAPKDAQALAGKSEAERRIHESVGPAPKPSAYVEPPKPSAVTHEAESLKLLALTRGRAIRQAAWGAAEFQWSGEAQLLWSGGGVRDRLRVGFDAPAGGRRTLVLRFTRSTDYAIVRVSLNGKIIDDALDLYAPQVGTLERSYRLVEVKGGANQLEIEILGSNREAHPLGAASELLQVGVDFVAIRP
jgi:hypothetical protein